MSEQGKGTQGEMMIHDSQNEVKGLGKKSKGKFTEYAANTVLVVKKYRWVLVGILGAAILAVNIALVVKTFSLIDDVDYLSIQVDDNESNIRNLESSVELLESQVARLESKTSNPGMQLFMPSR